MTHIETRHDTAAGWTATNPVLNPGELGIETNTRKMKFGDGVTAWNSLLYIVSPITATKADVGLSNVDNTSDDAKPLSSAATAALAAKAPLASPTFTGDPKAPTPATADNDTSIATTAYVNAVLAATTQFARYQNIPSGTTNLNTLTETGGYSVPPGSTNGPAGFDNGYVSVVGTSSFTSQIAQSINGDRLWQRARNAGTWTAWRELGGRNSVLFATTANDTLSGLAARDGVTPVAGDYCLAKNQTTPKDNGIWVAASGAWTRAPGADSAEEIAALGPVTVRSGTVNGGTVWTTSFRSTAALGTASMLWSKKSGADNVSNVALGGLAAGISGAYSIVNGLVTVTMAGTNGSASGTTLATVGSAAWPDRQMQFLVQSSGTLSGVYVDTSGNIKRDFGSGAFGSFTYVTANAF